MSLVRICAITCDGYPDDPLVRRTAEAAATAELEYHVICSMKEGQQEYEIFNGVHVHRIPIRWIKRKGRITGMPFVPTLVSWLFFAMLAFAMIVRLHLKVKFDVVHVHNMPDFLVFAAIGPKLLGARVILHIQDISPELMAAKSKGLFRRIAVPLAKWQERISTAFADHVLTVGWPFEERLLKRGVPREKLSSVLNSADPNVFPVEKRTAPFLGQATAERPIILMYHGSCVVRSGLDGAVRAFAKARATAPYLRLHFMGSGEALPHLRQLAQSLNVSDYVTFFPPGPVDIVVDFVAQGDIGIIPYPSTGFTDLLLPTKAYEFALMRRPMIVSNTRAMRSMFRPTSVIVCEPANIDDFAAAIVYLYQHPEKRAELVANAEQDYRKYRWEIMADRYRQLIASLCTKGGKTAMSTGEAGEFSLE